MLIFTPPIYQKRQRNSNLELYRIIVMLLIVAHHYVVNSGLYDVLVDAPFSSSFVTMLLFGAWGKTGINCFILITGYFMCKSDISLRKIFKLYLQITIYALIIYGVFCVSGHEDFSIKDMLIHLFPVRSLSDNFVGCFMVFYLIIPFLNILINNLDKRNHAMLLAVTLGAYTILPCLNTFHLTMNYVSWFSILYFVASYIRKYGLLNGINHRQWGVLTIGLIMIASLCSVTLAYIYKSGWVNSFIPYFLLTDSNKIFALTVAVASFMYFKDLEIRHSRIINAIGGATFGVLLIHANSDAMRTWLWRDTVDCVGHYSDSLVSTLSYALLAVIAIFIVCAGIDWVRGKVIEPPILYLYDSFKEKRLRRISIIK